MAASSDPLRGPKRQKMQLAMEEAELRSLRIPSAAHRGALSPSKNSFLPTLQEEAQERIQQLHKRERHRRSLSLTGDQRDASPVSRRLQQHEAPPEQLLLADISADFLDVIKKDFIKEGGVLDLEQFSRAMLHSLSNPERVLDADGSRRSHDPPSRDHSGALLLAEAEAKLQALASEGVLHPSLSRAAGFAEPSARSSAAARVAAAIDLFRRVDVHGEGQITWEEVSNYFIEQGMAGRDEFTVDSIKQYEASTVVDQSKHESAVEKLVYLEQVDAIVCLSHNSWRFRLYDPKRCVVKHEVSGHRGTVVNCCYVDVFDQIATTSADMTVCLWDAQQLKLRNRMSTKEVQLCVQFDALSNSLFSGSIDGTLSRWDLQHMCLADTRRGQHKQEINALLAVPDVNLLASASSDGTILMWDTETMRWRKQFKGHRKGTFSLAYSMDYHCLLTAGLDQEALVWNPYVEKKPIFNLKGHAHALCGVAVVPGTPQILSADVTGVFRLWDMRNFRTVQSFGGNESFNDFSSFCAMPQHKRLAAGGSKLLMYDYMDEWGGESVTDTSSITDALYSPNAGTFYSISKRTVKAWDSSSGQLFKVLRNVATNEITAATLSDNGRKLYLGDACGRVTAHGLSNGTLLTEFDGHGADISCLAVWKGTNKLASASWDGVVKVHSDERSRPPQLKQLFDIHRDGVTCLACSPELWILASGGTDQQVVIYDLRTLKLEYKFERFKQPIAAIDVLPNRCLLAVADQGGCISLWRLRPHPDKYRLVALFANLPGVGKQLPGADMPDPSRTTPPVPVGAVRFLVHRAPLATVGDRSWLYTADAKGGMRCWDLEPTFERCRVVEEDLEELFQRQRSGRLMPAAPPPAAQAQPPAPAAAPVPVPPPMPALPAPPPAGPSRTGPDQPPPAAGAGARQQQSAVPQQGRGSSTGGAAFITSVDAGEGSDDEDRGNPSTTLATTVRTAVHGDRPVPRPLEIPGRASPDRQEVPLLFEVTGHSDAIISMYVLQEPDALITCGLDRRVRTWSCMLELHGTLLQSGDRSYCFPHNRSLARGRQLDEAMVLLQQLGSVERPQRLPALVGMHSGKDATTTLLDFGPGKRKSPQKKSHDAAWKMAVDQVIANPNADEEDYRMLFQQMERLSLGGNGAFETAPNGKLVEERLFRHANARRADQMRQRSTALSTEEANAANRLARAMAALGGDDFGTYSAMASSIQPRLGSKSPPLVGLAA